jgi:hypothetical protein
MLGALLCLVGLPRTKTLPPLHGGYRPKRGGYPSSNRSVRDLPRPPKGPGAGSSLPR